MSRGDDDLLLFLLRTVSTLAALNVLVEACVDSVESSVAAARGGADRLELCDALFDGGTTPSAGMIAACKEAVSIPVVVMIRPRGGGFVYSDEEGDVMRRDVIIARDIGADGVAIGGLKREGAVDIGLVDSLVRAAAGLPVTFHRAFDFAPDRVVALEQLVSAGVSRILTSGGASTALEGAPQIADLVRVAADRITMIAGGGIREHNVLGTVATSGVREVHVRLTRIAARVESESVGRELRLRKELPLDELLWEETDEDQVHRFVKTLASIQMRTANSE